MRCAQVQGLFSEIYDGVAEQQADLVQHLQHCPACGLEYKRYSQLMDELKQLPEPELPTGFHESIMGKIREIAESEPSSSMFDNDVASHFEWPDKAAGNVIDVQFSTRNRSKQANKAVAISRRWASVAAAACVLLISLWAVRIFDLPTSRFNESAEYEMAMPQAMVAPVYDADFETQVAAAPDEEAAGGEAFDDAADFPPPMGRVAMDVLYDDHDIAGDVAPQEASPEYEYEQTAPWVAISGEISVEEQDQWYDLDDFSEEEPPLMAVANDMTFDEQDLWHDHDSPAAELFTPMIITIDINEIEDFTVPTTQSSGISLWDIAFVGGIAVLLIAVVAMLWNIRKSRELSNTP